jgi:dTMP kinase
MEWFPIHSGPVSGRGRFISLEGGEGVGKSTQIGALAQFLTARGKSVIETREPGGTAGAEVIRALLMTGDEDRWNAETEALLFAAARADHVAKLILPALEKGTWVLCDRFVDSTRAYQGAAGGVSDTDIMDLHRIGSHGILPDLTLLLDLPLEVGRVRAITRDGGGGDRMGGKADDYYERVVARFRSLARECPDRFCIIDAGGSIAEVSHAICCAVDVLM